ncbi:MAG TPA: ribosomal protein S18-alanine N-acetyltransferase [Casimicrobiaceae bacterium]|nr:ribosomal protein S18-alanine N-acetyltransferase [Casimicrobiaceae bacterium]
MNAALAKAFDASSLLWRPLRTEDVPAVAALEHESHLAPWTPDNFIDALAAGYSLTVGVTADMIVAYGVLLLAPGEAQLLNLTVAPRARRQGLGRTLLKRFLAAARLRGAEQCFLEVRVSNSAAIALYAAERFVAVARRVAYYPPAATKEREDALVMRRALAVL